MAIFSAIAGAISTALFAGSALATTLIGSALAFGAQIGVQYLNRPKKRTYSAVQGDVQFGGDVPVQTLFGIGKTKGQRIFYAKWDKGNKWNADVFLLANGWCDGLEPYVYIFGEKKNLISKPKTGGEVARYFVQDYVDDDGDGVIVLRFYDGRPGQVVDQRLVDITASLGKKWKATSVNAGLCYVIVERRWSDQAFGSKGRPEIEFVLRGLREYDPRKDSTVAGGSGTQRLNNPATWVHTTNPAVHRLNYQLGLRAMVSGRTLIGEGKSLGQLDLATYFVAMNVCDELRTDGKKRYQCSLFATGEDDHTEILKEFDDAMAGYGLNRRGLSGVVPGAPQIPVLAITADDIPADRAKDIQFRKSAFDRFNHLSGQFTSIEAMWNPESLKPVYVNADVAADGRNRQASNDFLQVTDPDIAQYLLNIRYRQNRKGGTATLPVSRRVGLKVQEGEWVTWRGRTWMISEWALDESFRVTLKLTETGADIYDDEDIEPGPIVIPPTPPINPSLLSTVQNFTVEPWSVENEKGYKAPALRFRWAPPSDPTIVAVRIEYRVAGSSEILKATSNDAEGGVHVITTNIVPSKVYEARATITTVPDRLKTWTLWATTEQATVDLQIILEYLAADVRAALTTLLGWINDQLADQVGQNAQAILQEVQDRVAAINAEQSARVDGAIEASQRYRAILDEIASIRDYAVNLDFAQYEQKEELRRTLTQRLNSIYAEFDERITIATGIDGGVVQRITTLEVRADDANASILQVEAASVARDNALTTQIGLLSAATASQFDPAKLWPFDAGVEGWNGNGTPTAANGYLRPANQAADPYVVSPSGLGVNANQYRQVRARVKKTGAPVWEGYCWWKATGDVTWDGARRATVASPAFDPNGFGLITFDLNWTGSIDQIRLDLSAAQTATDYFEIDVVSIGAPSPGASRAELLAEQQARASGDAANAQSITALQALFQDVNGDVTALASGVSALSASVQTLEDGVSAQGDALTSLTAEVAQKASLTALQSLSAEVEALGGGGIVSQGEALTALRNELLNLASEALDQGFAAYLGQQALRGALTQASQSLSTRIESTNNSLNLVAEAVTQVQAVLPTLATAQAVTSLASRVTAAEGSISSSSSAITALQNALPGKADGSALTALSQTVSQQGQTLTSQGSAITSVQNALGGKADASALQALSNTVSQQGDAITSQGSAITSVQNAVTGKADASALQSLSNTVSDQGGIINSHSQALTSISNSLDGKASVSALNGLTGTVSDQGGQISAQASALTALSATVGGLSADARLKFEVVPSPSGYSRIGARARFDTNGAYREAAWFVDVPADPANPTQFLVTAQRFAVIDGAGSSLYPFVYEDGVLKLAVAHIQTLLSGTINFGNGRVIINSSGITVST